MRQAVVRAHPDHLLRNRPYVAPRKRTPLEENIMEKLTQDIAREIMGERFLGTAETEQCFGNLSEEQQKALRSIPFSEKTLSILSRTHVLIADVGISLTEIYHMYEEVFDDWEHRSPTWLKDPSFANNRGYRETPKWRLVNRYPNLDSLNKSFPQQQAITGQHETILTSRQLIFACVLNQKARNWKEGLFYDRLLMVPDPYDFDDVGGGCGVYFRTADPDHQGRHAIIRPSGKIFLGFEPPEYTSRLLASVCGVTP